MKFLVLVSTLFLLLALGQGSTGTKTQDRTTIQLLDDPDSGSCSPVLVVEDSQDSDVAILTTFYWQRHPQLGRLLLIRASSVDIMPGAAMMGDSVTAKCADVKRVEVRLESPIIAAPGIKSTE